MGCGQYLHTCHQGGNGVDRQTAENVYTFPWDFERVHHRMEEGQQGEPDGKGNQSKRRCFYSNNASGNLGNM